MKTLNDQVALVEKYERWAEDENPDDWVEEQDDWIDDDAMPDYEPDCDAPPPEDVLDDDVEDERGGPVV